jgi:hypothetical protein
LLPALAFDVPSGFFEGPVDQPCLTKDAHEAQQIEPATAKPE